MKNKKGFTIIELIVVIAILGILTTVIIISISGYINNARNKYNDILKNNLLVNGKDYLNDFPNQYPSINSEKKVNLIDLINNNYLSSEMKDYDKNSCDNSYVYVRNVNGKYEYHSCLICGNKNHSSNDKYCNFTGNSNEAVSCNITNNYGIGQFNKNDIKISGTGKDGVKYFEVNGKILDANYNTTNKNYQATTIVSDINNMKVYAYNNSGIKSTCTPNFSSELVKCSVISRYDINNYNNTKNDILLTGIGKDGVNHFEVNGKTFSATYNYITNRYEAKTTISNVTQVYAYNEFGAKSSCSIDLGGLYDSTGNYSFAVAGAHNIEVVGSNNFTADNFNNNISPAGGLYVYLGVTKLNERKFVKNKTGFNAIDNDSSITNISGSYLNLNGTAEKVYLYVHTNVLRTRTNNFTVLISPDGVKHVLSNQLIDDTWQYKGPYTTGDYTLYGLIYDVTNIVKSNGKGWYYVSLNDAILDGGVDNEYLGWGMLALDESSSYPKKHIKFSYNTDWARYDSIYQPAYYTINTDTTIDNSVSSTIDIAGISIDAEPLPSNNQLYLVVGQTEYNLKQLKDANNNYYFPTRKDNTGFLYSVCDTTRKTSYKNCYEFDIFNGKIPSSLLNGNSFVKLKLEVEKYEGGVFKAPLIGIGIPIK